MASGYNAPGGLDTTPEVGGIDPASQDHLVNVAKLSHGEVGRQELEGDQRVLYLVAQALKREVEDLVVVEGEPGGWLVDREPGRFHHLAAGRDLGAVRADERGVRDHRGLDLRAGAELEGG